MVSSNCVSDSLRILFTSRTEETGLTPRFGIAVTPITDCKNVPTLSRANPVQGPFIQHVTGKLICEKLNLQPHCDSVYTKYLCNDDEIYFENIMFVRGVTDRFIGRMVSVSAY